MGKKFFFTAAMVVLGLSLSAQESESPWTAGADMVSTYVWRGLYLSNAAVQPSLGYSSGGFDVAAWGSAGFDGSLEADLYASYTFDFGLMLGVTDYYFPTIDGGSDYFDTSKATGAHILELNGGYELSGFSFSANYVLNETGGAGSVGGDKYFEVGYLFRNISLFVGGGDGLQTEEGDFNITNVGIGVTRELVITPSFSLPLTCSAILNPDREKFYLVAALSF